MPAELDNTFEDATVSLSPVEKEKRKSRLQRARDFAYTVNHAIVCTVTDLFGNPFLATFFDNKVKSIAGCSAGNASASEIVNKLPFKQRVMDGWSEAVNIVSSPDLLKKRVKAGVVDAMNVERIKDWAKGEFIGDWLSVPITLMVQRAAPGFMHGIRQGTDMLLGWAFRAGIGHASKRWAKEHNIAVGSDEFKEHVSKIYEDEMSHLPQAVVWTASSLAINVTYQMTHDKDALPFWKKLGSKMIATLTGQCITAATVIGSRAFAPNTVRKMDHFTGKNIVAPTTKFFGGLVGIKSEDLDAIEQEDSKHANLPDSPITLTHNERKKPWTQTIEPHTLVHTR